MSADPAHQTSLVIHPYGGSPKADPRIDRRLRATLAEFGLDEAAINPSVTRAANPAELLAVIAEAEVGGGELYETLPNDLPGDADIDFDPQTIEGADGNQILLRIYRAPESARPAPCVVYFHGGGMAILDAFAKVHHRWSQDLAASGLVVIAVDFRNAYSPDGLNPFPAGLNDCASTVRWAHAHRDELGISKIVLQGESGGANLSLATALMAKRDGFIDAIDGVYATGPYISGVWGTWSDERKADELPSLLENDGYFVNCAMWDLLAWIYDPSGEHAEDPLCWPYSATASDLVGLPPHVIVVNELDPLRDEGISYYRRLLEAGVESVGRVNLGVVHASDTIFRKAIPNVYFGGIGDIRRFAFSL